LEPLFVLAPDEQELIQLSAYGAIRTVYAEADTVHVNTMQQMIMFLVLQNIDFTPLADAQDTDKAGPVRTLSTLD
jgi:hypothetical protein